MFYLAKSHLVLFNESSTHTSRFGRRNICSDTLPGQYGVTQINICAQRKQCSWPTLVPFTSYLAEDIFSKICDQYDILRWIFAVLSCNTLSSYRGSYPHGLLSCKNTTSLSGVHGNLHSCKNMRTVTEVQLMKSSTLELIYCSVVHTLKQSHT